MGKNKIIQLLIYIFLLVIAGISLLYGLGFWRTSWSFKCEVELVDFINIIVTVFTAVCAAWYISKKISEERFFKELIISDLRKIEELISSVIEILIRNEHLEETQKQEILNLIGYLKNLIDRFEFINEYNNQNSRLRTVFFNFYGLSTDFGSDNNIDIQNVIMTGNKLIKEVRCQIININER